MTTIAKTIAILCPSWCSTEENNAHDPLFVDGTLHVDHQGPDFGDHMYGNGAQVEDAVAAEVMVSDLAGRMSAAGLRQLASDALIAAEWLEAQQ